MSTRCNIIVRDKRHSIQIYKHCDGYPDDILDALKEALNYSWELPRMEASDFSAAIVKVLKDGAGDTYIEGTGIATTTLHGDLSYYYIVTSNEDLGCWVVETFGYNYDTFPRKTELISTTELR